MPVPEDPRELETKDDALKQREDLARRAYAEELAKNELFKLWRMPPGRFPLLTLLIVLQRCGERPRGVRSRTRLPGALCDADRIVGSRKVVGNSRFRFSAWEYHAPLAQLLLDLGIRQSGRKQTRAGPLSGVFCRHGVDQQPGAIRVVGPARGRTLRSGLCA